jgi:signal transduction histidine kinase
MNGRGKLTIEVGNAFLNDDYTRSHPDVSPGQYVLLAVTDTGTGIAPEIIDKVFEPFFTTKPPGEGTGLGLAISFGIVRDHGGTLTLESKVGKGTTFFIRLPIPAASELAVPLPAPAPDGSSEPAGKVSHA